MAVSATELRPRGPVALFDAAIRLCARASGAWALTLPGGAAVTFAILEVVEAVSRARPLLWPSLLFTVAWLFRGLCQAATCHHLDALIVGEKPTTPWQSFTAAARRLPSVVITAAYLPVFNLLSLTITVGVGYFLLASHLAAWAVVMKGKGHPLALYGTCAKLLGPARSNTATVRMLFMSGALVALNVHIAATVLVYLGRKLIGLDLTYVQRFVAADNGAWIAVVLALTFVLFEPLRAAVATLLVIDGRVRQEGLDLMAAVEQLPQRTGRRSAAAGALLAAAVGLIALGTPQAALAQGQPASSGTASQRLVHVAQACELPEQWREGLGGLERLGPPEQAALRRLADDVEHFAFTWQDCDEAEARLERALPVLWRTSEAAAVDGASAHERAKAILARPEFEPPPEPVAEQAPEEEPDPDSLWARFGRWLDELFRRLFDREPRSPRSGPAVGGGMAVANAVALVLLAAVIILAGVLVVLAFRNRERERGDVEVEQGALALAAADPDNALSRAPEGWASLADELALQGRYREAVRSLYLALLSKLHRAGAIDYDPTQSNWDYCRRFRGNRAHLPTFRDLTLRFDFAWYGVAELDQPAYLTFRKLSEPLLRQEPAPQAGTVPLTVRPPSGPEARS